ncbi:cold-shock protein [Actinomadura gamaensis]|uniref:Cold-shock protein n=1 Tax=Actinomadura gamaensis TaxID=1763541 RepID=A0ABV9TYK7_9ACTN
MDEQPVEGVVRAWDDEQGWGVLASPGVPGEVWAHFSAVLTGPGEFASLSPGEPVVFRWERADQDGYAYRATEVRRPGDPSGPPPGDDPGADIDARIEWDE